MPYEILQGEQGERNWTPCNHYSMFDSPAECAQLAQNLNSQARDYGWTQRYKVSKVTSDDSREAWKIRERAKFDSGEYQPTPWNTENWYVSRLHDSYPNLTHHFCHLSKSKPGYVAFTECNDHGEADRQTRIRVGRYLRRFSGLDDVAVSHLAARCGVIINPPTLQFADESLDIVRVYTSGPSSCMSHHSGDYATEVHPCFVYGAGDLSVAYIETGEPGDDGDDEGDKRITARAVCWPAKNTYGNIYGDEERLEPLLEDAGYERADSFYGARLLHIPHNGTVVAPYMDDDNRAASVSADGKHLIIGDGPLDLQENTNGTADCSMARCPNCGEYYDSDDEGTYVSGEDLYWCGSCVSDDSFYCECCSSNHAIANTDSHTCNDGNTVCDRCAERYGHFEECGTVRMQGQDVCECEECENARAEEEEEEESDNESDSESERTAA